MPSRTFALSWNRSDFWAKRLGKPPGRAVSDYRTHRSRDVMEWVEYLNSLDPQLDCRIETFGG